MQYLAIIASSGVTPGVFTSRMMMMSAQYFPRVQCKLSPTRARDQVWVLCYDSSLYLSIFDRHTLVFNSITEMFLLEEGPNWLPLYRTLSLCVIIFYFLTIWEYFNLITGVINELEYISLVCKCRISCDVNWWKNTAPFTFLNLRWMPLGFNEYRNLTPEKSYNCFNLPGKSISSGRLDIPCMSNYYQGL